MKKILLLFVFLMSYAYTYAQEKVLHFCTISFGVEKTITHSALIDFGDSKLYMFVKGEKKMKESYAYYINLMVSNGWKYVESINDDTLSLPVLLFSKEIKDEEELTTGLELKEY